MALGDFNFDPATGWNDTNKFPDYPARDQVRPLLQKLFDQIKTWLNVDLKTFVNGIDASLTSHKADYTKEATEFTIDSDSTYTRTNCKYYKKNGWVKLIYSISRVDDGLMELGENMALLPVGFRPKTSFVTIAVQSDVGVLPPFDKMTLRVFSTGELQIREDATKKTINGEVVFYAGGGTV